MKKSKELVVAVNLLPMEIFDKRILRVIESLVYFELTLLMLMVGVAKYLYQLRKGYGR